MTQRESALPMNELDAQTRDMITSLLHRTPESLDEAELAFLRARSPYLTLEQRRDFGLEKAPAPTADPVELPVTPKSKGKSKKSTAASTEDSE